MRSEKIWKIHRLSFLIKLQNIPIHIIYKPLHFLLQPQILMVAWTFIVGVTLRIPPWLNLQYYPYNKTRKSNHSLIVVVIIQIVVKKKNKTALFFFSTYKILWPNPYYQIHGQILLTLSVNNKQRLHLNQEVYLIEDINVWYWEYEWKFVFVFIL